MLVVYKHHTSSGISIRKLEQGLSCTIVALAPAACWHLVGLLTCPLDKSTQSAAIVCISGYLQHIPRCVWCELWPAGEQELVQYACGS
jgi:hypothetical protein